ncbi:unnamed protein product [Candidula unifasciata]|uniref:PDZ domain-containing protein n=1 Tax=Candidula unifasciata TaxID=100452 RepID=A0A8S3YXU9_9EUPU|nr:unnamed protein product [Candidula unifasciata]
MPGSRLQIHLFRDSFNTPWGFRLQGGKDLHQPLTVQRVFSNSPAEGELQRGDVILSINNRDASELTHKQAQDLIKHGGGQIELVINRPPPGVSLWPLSPPIITHQPRAPSLASPSPPSSSFRQIPIQVLNLSPQPRSDGGFQQPTTKPVRHPIHVQPAREAHFEQQPSFSNQQPKTSTPTSPVPSWAAQHFIPKKVLTLAKLGGGGQDFGTAYATFPRRASSTNYGASGRTQGHTLHETDETPEDHLATGPIPKVGHLRNLDGGGREFGSAFGSATLPRSGKGHRLTHPPASSHAGGHGFQPSKVTLNKFGGGGRDLGVAYGQRNLDRFEPRHDKHGMLSRVQNSLDNLVLSPRSPEIHSSSPFYQPYTPPYQPPQQMYTPTGLLLEQQQQLQQQNQGEALPPVWERRRLFQQGPVQTSGNVPAYKSAPTVPKPQPGPSSYGTFGIDYTHPTSKQPQSGWRPAPQFNASQAPIKSAPPQYTFAPPPTSEKPATSSSYAPAHSAPPPWQRAQEQENGGTPAWRSSLKATGVKPWDMDPGYTNEQAPIRSVPYTPAPAKSPVTSGPFSPTGATPGGAENGPKVMHLQYNSPLNLYSNQNVAETLKGQTQALAGQPQRGAAPVNEAGERDWSQSAVLRFISQEGTGKGKQLTPSVAPKPQFGPVHTARSAQPFYQDSGATEF